MIDLEKVWLPQVILYAHFISNRNEVRTIWIVGDHSRDSVTDFDELITQVFDDLCADEMVGEPLEKSSVPKKAKSLVRDFIDKLDDLDKLDRASEGLSPTDLVNLPQWAKLEESATNLAVYAGKTGLLMVPDPTA